MGIKEENLGKIGQEKGRILLHKFFGATRVMQVDWMSDEYEGYVLNEVKNQNPFEPPPFKGQGLPLWQIKARIEFFERIKIRGRLIVFNPLDKFDIIWQWLDILEQGEKHDTQGRQPRRVYSMDSFLRIKPESIPESIIR